MNKVYIIGINELHYYKDTRVKRPEVIKPEGLYFFCGENYEPLERYESGVLLFNDKRVIDPDINKNRKKYKLISYEILQQIKGL